MRSTFYCVHCNSKMFVHRNNQKLRKQGHIKTMWCWNCKAVKPFTEGISRRDPLYRKLVGVTT